MASQLQNTKVVGLMNSFSLPSGTMVSAIVDTLGYDHCEIAIWCATQGTTAAIPGTFEVHEAADTAATSFAAVSGYTANAATTDFVAGATSGTTPIAPCFRASLPLNVRKRYLRVKLTSAVTNTALGSGCALLSRAEEAPVGTNVGGAIVKVPS